MLCFDVIFCHNPEASEIRIVHCSYSHGWHDAPSHFIQFVTMNRARPKQSIPAGDLLLNGLLVAWLKLVLLSFVSHTSASDKHLAFI